MPDEPIRAELTNHLSSLGLTSEDFEDLDLEDPLSRHRESSVHPQEHVSQRHSLNSFSETSHIRRGSTGTVMNPLNIGDVPGFTISPPVASINTEVILACIFDILERESQFSNHLRWSALVTVLPRLGTSLTLSREGLSIPQSTPYKRKELNPEAAKATRCEIHFLRGNGLPLQTASTISTTSGVYTFLENVGQYYLVAVKLATLAFVGYQLVNEKHRSIIDILNIWSSQTKTAARNFIHFAVGEEWEWFLGLLPLPAVIAIVQSAISAWRSTQQDERIDELIAKIKAPTVSYWIEWLNWYNPLASLFDGTTIALIHAHKTLTWKGSLSLDKQKALFQAVVQLAQAQTPQSTEAMKVLGQLLQSDHISDLAKVSGGSAQRKEFLRQRLLMKAQALTVIKNSAFTLVSATTPLFKQFGHAYSSLTLRSLLWEAGYNREGFVNGHALSIYFAFWKTISAYFLGQLASIFIQEINQYLECPEMPYSFVTGQYDTRFDKMCFNEAVKLYNILPGEPPENLFGNLDQYRLGSTYALDLSGKGLDGGTIATILKLFRDQHINITALNLSGNAIGLSDPSGTIALGEELAHLKSLQRLNLSHNQMSYSDFGDSSALVVIGKSLKQLTALKTLDLSNNGIGSRDDTDSRGTVAIANGLGYLTELTTLNLSHNDIGIGDGRDSNGTVAIGNGLSRLKVLTTLDLSFNYIGAEDNTDSRGTVTIGNGLGHLTELTTLDLSYNQIGYRDYGDSTGTVAIGNGLGHLTELTTLNLSHNGIGLGDGSDSSGTVAIGNGLGHLTELTTLDLSHNGIGLGDGSDSSGTVAIGNGLSDLISLEILDLSENLIGFGNRLDSRGAVAIGNGLAQLRKLKTLDLAQNYIGSADQFNSNSTVAISESISRLSSLQRLDISENYISLEESAEAFYRSLRHLHIYKNASNVVVFPQESYGLGSSILNQIYPIDQRPFLNATNVADYFSSINPLTTQIDLSGRIANLSLMGEVMSALERFPLESLSLSSNSIGATDAIDPSNTMALGNGLSRLTSLKMLDLSGNWVGYGDASDSRGTAAIGNGLGHLTGLKTLDLSGNKIASEDAFHSSGTVAIGKGLGQLTSLTTLDLSSNWIGYGDEFDSRGTVAIGKGLGQLTSLTTLNLSHNNIGFGDDTESTSRGSVALGNGLGQLTALKTLDLSSNWVGYGDELDSRGTVGIGEGLGRLQILTTLDLSFNYIGAGDNTDSRGTVALGQGLGRLEILTTLNLSFNNIGLNDNSDSNGTMAIGSGLRYLIALKTLNLDSNNIGSHDDIDSRGTVAIGQAFGDLSILNSLDLSLNHIGSGGPQSPAAFLESIPKLKQLQNLNLYGMTNISWAQAAKDLASFRRRLLADECQAELCNGASITHSGDFSASSSLVSVRGSKSTTLIERAVDTFCEGIKSAWDYWAGALVNQIACTVVECPTYFPRESLRGSASHWSNSSGFFNGSQQSNGLQRLAAPGMPAMLGMR